MPDYDYDIRPSIERERSLPEKRQRKNQCGEREVLEEQDDYNELIERVLALSAEMRSRDIDIEKQAISKR